MEVKRIGEIVTIKMSNQQAAEELQRTLDYARILEITGTLNKTQQDEVDKFADEIKREWWTENKSRFVE